MILVSSELSEYLKTNQQNWQTINKCRPFKGSFSNKRKRTHELRQWLEAARSHFSVIGAKVD